MSPEVVMENAASLGIGRFPIDLKVKDGPAFFDGDGFQPPDP